VISVEDVGKGNIMMPVIVESLYRMHQRISRPSGDRFLFAAHAIRLIAESPKDRTSDDTVNFAKLESQTRDKAPEIPDFAIDMHTKRGWDLGHGYEHFMKEASHIENPVKDRDNSYRDRIIAAIESGELSRRPWPPCQTRAAKVSTSLIFTLLRPLRATRSSSRREASNGFCHVWTASAHLYLTAIRGRTVASRSNWLRFG
jgi:MgsA AAA+ ATPase C terminal